MSLPVSLHYVHASEFALCHASEFALCHVSEFALCTISVAAQLHANILLKTKSC